MEKISEIKEWMQNGYSYRKIAEKCNTSDFKIRKALNELTKEEQDKLLFYQNINSQAFANKDLLDEVITLGRRGYTNLEIGIILGIPDKLVCQTLKELKRSGGAYQDNNLYKLIKERQQKTLDKGNDYLKERILLLIKEYHMNLIDLENISRNLIVKNIIRNQIKELLKNDYLNDFLPKSYMECAVRYHINYINIERFFLDAFCFSKVEEEKAIRIVARDLIKNDTKEKKNDIINDKLFWLLLILHFRLSLEDVGKLLGSKDIKGLHDMIIKEANLNGLGNALKFLWGNNEPSHYGSAFFYLQEVKKAKINSDKKRLSELYAKITDEEYFKLINEKEENGLQSYTDEEVMIITKHIIKYALPTRKYPFREETLRRRCSKDLTEVLENLHEFNKNLYIKQQLVRVRK